MIRPLIVDKSIRIGNVEFKKDKFYSMRAMKLTYLWSMFYLWSSIINAVSATVDVKCETVTPEKEENVVSELLNIAGNLIDSAKKYEKIKDRYLKLLF